MAAYKSSRKNVARWRQLLSKVLGRGGHAMRCTLVPVLLFVATACHGADDTTTASRTLDGKKVQFPAKSVPEGVKACIDVLESCSLSTESSDAAADLKKAQEGDHVRLVFAKSVIVEVLNKEIEVSEVVYSGGVFWLRFGDKVQRCTKYQNDKWKPFEAWFRQPLKGG